MITSIPFRFMVKTEGLLWMHVREPEEHRPSPLQASQSKCLVEQPLTILYILLSLFLLCVSLCLPSYGRMSSSCPVKFLHSTLCIHISICTLCEQKLQWHLVLCFKPDNKPELAIITDFQDRESGSARFIV